MPWTREEEQELIQLFKEKTSIPALAKRFNRKPKTIEMKLRRLGLDVAAAKIQITGSLEIPKELPSLEEVLKIVAGAIQKACQPGLGKTELQRLSTIADLYKAYAAGIGQYIDYRQIEAKLLELEDKYAKLAKEKTQGNASAKTNTS